MRYHNKIITKLEDYPTRSLMEEMYSDLVQQHSRNFDKIVFDGIKYVTGSNEIKLDELKGRLKWVHFPDARQEFHLDGEPFLEMYPPQFKNADNKGVSERKIRVKQKYKYIGRALPLNK